MRFARVTSTLAEGLRYSRETMARISAAEQHFGLSLAALKEVECKIDGETGFEGAKQMLVERIANLESDIQGLRLMRERISGFKSDTDGVVVNLRTYARQRIEAVFGGALAKYKRKSSASGEMGTAGFEAEPEPEAVACEPVFTLIALHEDDRSGLIERGFEADLDTLSKAVAVLEYSTEHWVLADDLLAQASDTMCGMSLNYERARDSIEGSTEKAPIMAEAKDGLARLIGKAYSEMDLMETLGLGVKETVVGVLEALDKSMQAVLDMLDPKAVAKFLAQRTASAGESTAAPAEVHEVDLDPTPGPVALSRGTPSPGVLGDRTPAPVLDTPGPEIADGLVTDKGPDFGQPLALGHCFDHINEGKFEAVVAYFKVYGDQDSESVFERLNRHADRGIPQALAVIGVLETLAKDEGCPVKHTATDMLYSASQSTEIPAEVSAAASSAYFRLSQPADGTAGPKE